MPSCRHTLGRRSIGALLTLAEGQALLQDAAVQGVVVRTERLPMGVLGSYRQTSRTITIDLRLMAYADYERAAVLAHELQHVRDHAAGRLGRGATCLANEEDALRTEGRIWASLWGGRLPSPRNSVQVQLNDIALLAHRDPYLLITRYVARYEYNCR